MKIYFLTSNTGKFEWAKRKFDKFNIELIKKDIFIEESRDMDVKKVVKNKAYNASKIIKDPFIIEDSSFCIPVLNDFPATHIKFVLKTLGIKGILKLMENVDNRDVIIRSALIFSFNNKKILFFCDDKGRISDKEKGDNLHGFNELFKIFIPGGFSQTLAEMSDFEFKEYEKKILDEDHYNKFLRWFIENFKNEFE